MFDWRAWMPKARVWTNGDTTFAEAYQRTGRILNITTTPSSRSGAPSPLLNYLTAPNVVIWSAILASCSLPQLIHPVEYVNKLYHTI